jgi:hypothetical protein
MVIGSLGQRHTSGTIISVERARVSIRRGPPLDGPPNIWREVDLDGGWTAAFRFMHVDGDISLGEIRVYPTESVDDQRRRGVYGLWPGQWSAERLGQDAPVPRGGLPARVLRSVRVQEALVATMATLTRATAEAGDSALMRDALAPWHLDELSRLLQRRPGRHGRPDVEYAQIAQRYVNHVAAGNPKPIRELALQLGRPEDHIRQLIATARHRELLTRSARGRPGGHLTERACALLRDEARRKDSAHRAPSR